MHVLAPPTLPGLASSSEESGGGAPSLARVLAQQALDAAAQALPETSAIPVTTRLDTGPADACLMLRAEETAADLIVMGMASRPRWQRWFASPSV